MALPLPRSNQNFTIKKFSIQSQKSSRKATPLSTNHCMTDREDGDQRNQILTTQPQTSRSSMTHRRIRSDQPKDFLNLNSVTQRHKTIHEFLAENNKNQIKKDFSKPDLHLNLNNISSFQQNNNRSSRNNFDALLTDLPLSTRSKVMNTLQPSSIMKTQQSSSYSNLKNTDLMWLEIENIKLKSKYRPVIENFKQYRNLDVKTVKGNLYQKLISQTQKEQNKKEEIIEGLRFEIIRTQQAEEKRLIEEEELKQKQEDWQRQLEDLQQKRSAEIRRITVYHVCIALQLNYLHNELPSAKKFAKLVAKHFLQIMNYNPLHFRSQKSIKIIPSQKQIQQNNRFSQQQIKDIQSRLNQGREQRHSIIGTLQKIKIILVHRQKYVAADHFSPPVIKNIRVLQNALSMGLFKLKKHTVQVHQKTEKPPASPTRSKKSSIVLKLLKAKEKRKNVLFELQGITATHIIASALDLHPLIKHQGINLFNSIQTAITLAKKGELDQEIILQTATKINNMQNIAKKIHQLHYPSIRFISHVDDNFVIWKIKFKDFAPDNKTLVVFFIGSGQKDYIFRLDIPINQMNFQELHTIITIWPVVLLNLKGVFNERSYKRMYELKHIDSQPKNFKLNFLTGLNQKTIDKLKTIDFESMVESKNMLQFLQTKQIQRIRKLLGYTYELLPTLSSNHVVYLIDLPKIDKVIMEIKQYQTIIRQCKIAQILECSQDQLIERQLELNAYIMDHTQLINRILYFRFLSNSPLLRFDMTLQMMKRIKNRSILLQASLINIKSHLLSHVGDNHIKNQVGQHCLLILSIHLRDQIKVPIEDLLMSSVANEHLDYDESSPDNNETLLRFNEKSSLWNLCDSCFFLTVKVIFFAKESNQLSDPSKMNSYSLFGRNKSHTDIHGRVFSPLQIELNQFALLNEAVHKVDDTVKSQLCLSSILKSILLGCRLKPSMSHLMDQIIKDAFTVDFSLTKVVISKKYQHILNKTQTFINAMELIAKNKGDSNIAMKYSIYPFEAKDLFEDRGQTNNDEQQEGIRHTLVFQKMFQEVYVTDLKFKHDKNRQVQKMEEVVLPDDDSKLFRQKKVLDVSRVSNDKISIDASAINRSLDHEEMRSYLRIKIVHQGLSLLVCMTDNDEKQIKSFKYKLTIIFRKQNIKYMLFTNNVYLITVLKSCQSIASPLIQVKQVNTILFKIFIECCASYGSFLQQQGINHLYHPPHQLDHQSNILIPNYNIIKHKLISNSTDLLYFLNKVYFLFLFPGYRVDVLVYYSDHKDRSHIQGSRAIYNDSVERLYFCDEDYFLMHMKFYSLNSKMKLFKIIFNKYDLKDLLKSFNLRHDQPFGAIQIYRWAAELIKKMRFTRRFMYNIPQICCDEYSMGKYNDFQKNHFDQTKIVHKYLETYQKVFRVVGHFIQKLHIVTNNITLETNIISQILFQKNRYSTHTSQVHTEWCITTIMAHYCLDVWKVTYYFPKSKRQLTNYLTVINLQELDYKDTEIFRVLEFDQKFKNYQHLEKYFLKLNQGKLFVRKQTYLDMQIINKVRYKKLINQSQSQGGSNAQSQLQGTVKLLFEISKDFKIKSSGIKKAIQEDAERLQKVKNFMLFTRHINKIEDGPDTQRRYIEIKIWSILLTQALSLEISVPKEIQNIRTSLQEKVLDYYKEKLGRVRKQHRIVGRTFMLKRQILQNAQNHIKVQSMQLSTFVQFIEDHKVRFPEPHFVDSPLSYSLRIGQGRFQIIEYICCIQFRHEGVGFVYMECFLETIVDSCVRTLDQQAYSIFRSFQPIPYINTFDYNIYLRYYVSHETMQYRDVTINLRELLNLFISDGLFKSYTNYVNSKINLSDIESMCQYVTFKIQTANYLNLSHLDDSNITHSPLFEATRQQGQNAEHQTQDGQIFARTIRKNGALTLYQFQIFLHSNKIMVNTFNSQTAQFHQKEISFSKADRLVPHFTLLVKVGKIDEMLLRLFYVISVDKLII